MLTNQILYRDLLLHVHFRHRRSFAIACMPNAELNVQNLCMTNLRHWNITWTPSCSPQKQASPIGGSSIQCISNQAICMYMTLSVQTFHLVCRKWFTHHSHPCYTYIHTYIHTYYTPQSIGPLWYNMPFGL